MALTNQADDPAAALQFEIPCSIFDIPRFFSLVWPKPRERLLPYGMLRIPCSPDTPDNKTHIRARGSPRPGEQVARGLLLNIERCSRLIKAL